MDVMARRRALLMMPHGLDTSPVIDEYGVIWSRTYGVKSAKDGWCTTKSYDAIDAPFGTTNIKGFIGADSTTICFQYTFNTGTDWFYFNNTNPRKINDSASRKLTSITFSIEQSEIDNAYAYLVETGQIFFAGKNTPYFGHRNISELN